MSYDPFSSGPNRVGVRTIHVNDRTRNDRRLPVEIWYPASDSGTDANAVPGIYPLIVYSHNSLGHRCEATYLCTHLASHGYIVASVEHVPLPQRTSTITEFLEVWSEVRPADVSLAVDAVLADAKAIPAFALCASKVGVVGHSFGGWTVLTATARDRRIRTVVALAPAGASNPRPGIIPASVNFEWGRDVPTLYLVGDRDTLLPIEGMHELFSKTRSTKQMVVFRGADHFHFLDRTELLHEAFRKMDHPSEMAWVKLCMSPIEELSAAAGIHLGIRGSCLAQMDAVLKDDAAASEFLTTGLPGAFEEHGIAVEVVV